MRPFDRSTSRQVAEIGLAIAALILSACDGSPNPIGSRLDGGGGADGVGAPMLDFYLPDPADVECVAPVVSESCANGFCTLPAGCFTMGAPADDPCHVSTDLQNEVVLTHGLAVQTTEVTQQAFSARLGYSPSLYTGCGDCPVENVSWHEAVSYCNALSAAEGLAACYSCQGVGIDAICKPADAFKFSIYACPGYRLPTEAEWEYAARGGTQTSCYGGDILDCHEVDSTLDPIAWYQQNSGGTTHPVATKTPNAWGLYDMAGNVTEWVHDWWGPIEDVERLVDPTGAVDGISKVVRGGSHAQRPQAHRSAARLQEASTYKSHEVGFRCVRSLPRGR